MEKLGFDQFKCVGFVLVAGGLGERLGYDGIKISLPLYESERQASFMQLYCEHLLTMQKKVCMPRNRACVSFQACACALVRMRMHTFFRSHLFACDFSHRILDCERTEQIESAIVCQRLCPLVSWCVLCVRARVCVFHACVCKTQVLRNVQAGSKIPLAVMTSDDTHELTMKLLA